MFADGVVQNQGSIPSEIGLLTELEHLIIKNNQNLIGPLPTEIGNLINCYQLGIYHNALTGNIPNEIVHLNKLQYLNLAGNNLSGKLPQNIGLLTSLKKFIVDDNVLTGHIMPIQYRKMKNLKLLTMSKNRFAGTLPPAMKFLKSIEYLYLDNNNFSGRIPPEMKAMTNLKSLALGHNEFQFDIPSELGSLSQLQYASFNNNELESQVDGKMIANWFQLSRVFFQMNNLNGTIPGSIFTLVDLGKFGDSMFLLLIPKLNRHSNIHLL